MSAFSAAGVSDPPTPDWLTAALRQSGAMTSGSVLRVEDSANAAFNSAARHLRLCYSTDATPTLPRRLFFKRNLPEPWAVRAGEREVAFYQVAAQMAGRLPMLVPCYAAGYDADSGDSWLLLSDVSGTHQSPVTREQLIAGTGVPTDEQLAAMVEALAGLHAAWWQHPALGTGSLLMSEWYRDPACFASSHKEFTENWNALRQMGEATLPTATCALYDAALAGLPHIWERLLAERVASRSQFTISHGDCYFSQFLCPGAESADNTTYLIDFQGACGDLPAMDLVFLFATFWSAEQRQHHQREHRLLRAYLEALNRHGIGDYTWDNLVADYRIALVFMIFYPVWDAINGSSREYWAPKLRCLTSAAEDWRCGELLSSVSR